MVVINLHLQAAIKSCGVCVPEQTFPIAPKLDLDFPDDRFSYEIV